MPFGSRYLHRGFNSLHRHESKLYKQTKPYNTTIFKMAQKERDLKIISITLILGIIILVVVILSQSGKVSIEDSYTIAENFVKQSSTFRFDAIPESLIITNYKILNCSYCYSFTFTYKTLHAGCGNRSNQFLPEQITQRKVEVILERGRVTKAILDNIYDEIKGCFLNETLTKSLFKIITEKLT